ncbi:conserved hypothetical protein [Bradyrhizobium sp. ORS 278]|uniref:hypothetical protein n=1 Tax=Bradyrhizobium sp. (strain ORS 278) TaxID=114615 RepID=UPI0001508633|nr:hypothetical protein [Bradyrhizobium sp. ORS 278]CAL76543.1 conserved hypothetical protein [Bradyrhizobium sp. ORS 278]
MGQTAHERLREYLGQLPPSAQSLLMREFERAIERGQDVAVATMVLEQLRKVARPAAPAAAAAPTAPQVPAAEPARAAPAIEVARSPAREERRQGGDGPRRLFRPLEPFLTDSTGPLRPGQIRRASLLAVWQWLGREGAPERYTEFEAAMAAGSDSSREVEMAARKLQLAAADALMKLVGPNATGDRQRALARIGAPSVIEDLLPIALVLQNREALDGLNGRLPGIIRVLGDSQIASVTDAINVPSLQTPLMLPFALSMVMQRLAAPWQIIRLATKIAASDDEIRVAATPFGVAVTIALNDLANLASLLRADIRRGHFSNLGDTLKTLHDGVRGLRTELDLRSESNWGKQLTAIRADISNSLQSEIDSVPGRARRILRQRADKDIPAGAGVDTAEVEEVAALIEFVAVCRNYASELAINEVTLRTYTDLQQYVEKATEALVQSLRSGDARARAYRQSQVSAAIRFCHVLFGNDYAQLMSRAAENAMNGERKSSRAG